LANFLKKVFGSRNQRLLRQYDKSVKRALTMEAELESLSDDELRGKTPELKQRLADGAELASVLPEAFAIVREASKRTLGLRHFDEQLIGGMVLLEGNIAEMRTGEGKTLVATLPAYLNALAGTPVHIVTVNDYLAGRDANWMRPVYEFLGMSVGIIHTGQLTADKQEAYLADVTYGTNIDEARTPLILSGPSNES